MRRPLRISLQPGRLVQKGMQATEKTPREQMFLDAVAALYKNAGVGSSNTDRVNAYLAVMKSAVDKYPDDETKLFYAQMLLSTMPEGTVDDEIQPYVANTLEEIYARKPMHPGVLHYLTHVYDDPVNAQKGLVAARAYAKSAMAVPHAHHMPSHIFARLGLWEEDAAANESAWSISEADVKSAGESGEYRDFHALSYLQDAYIQLGRYRDAKRVTEIFQAQYDALPNKQTAPDTPLLEAKHVKGRTIYNLPDRVVYGYSDALTRYLIETGDWQSFSTIPLVAPSRDFVAMKTELDAAVAAKRGDAAAARAAADKLVLISNEPGQDPFVQMIITIQANEAEALAAQAAGDAKGVIAHMNEATGVEDSIFALSQPSYPAIPAHELYGNMLLKLNRPAEAEKQYLLALIRTPNRPKSIYGIARAAQETGDTATARQRYQQLLVLWKNADPDRPEIAVAKEFLAKHPAPVGSVAMLVQTSWLASHLADRNLVIVYVGKDRAGFDAGHIPGARFLALGDIVVERNGIPNLLPSVDVLKHAFERLGIGDESRVVLYGDEDNVFAARAYFSLDYLGDSAGVSLLDGGITKWAAEHGTVKSAPPEIGKGDLTVHPRPELVIALPALKQIVADRSAVLIDTRPPDEYSGAKPGTDIRRAGHIPGARLVYWRDLLVSEQNPTLLPTAEIRAKYEAAGAKHGGVVITYCRTGMQASYGYFTLKLTGFHPVLYDASFIEWSNHSDMPVQTGMAAAP